MTSKLHPSASKQEVVSFINKLLCSVTIFAATSEIFPCLQLGAGAAAGCCLPSRCASRAGRGDAARWQHGLLTRSPDSGLCAHVCAHKRRNASIQSAEGMPSAVLISGGDGKSASVGTRSWLVQRVALCLPSDPGASLQQ